MMPKSNANSKSTPKRWSLSFIIIYDFITISIIIITIITIIGIIVTIVIIIIIVIIDHVCYKT